MSIFYKDRDSKNLKLTMGPIWDYNLTYGNAKYCNRNDHPGCAFGFNAVCPKDWYQIAFWWSRLLPDLAFGKNTKERYKTLCQASLTPQRLVPAVWPEGGTTRISTRGYQ